MDVYTCAILFQVLIFSMPVGMYRKSCFTTVGLEGGGVGKMLKYCPKVFM